MVGVPKNAALEGIDAYLCDIPFGSLVCQTRGWRACSSRSGWNPVPSPSLLCLMSRLWGSVWCPKT
jgi:hypothetical protein